MNPYRPVLRIILLLASAAVFIPNGASAVSKFGPLQQSASEPLVLALYYTWFDENTWSYDKLSDLPAQPYASRDRAAMGRHIAQAQAAGIDAFLVAWYGPDNNQTESNLAALLDEAAARNFHIGVLFETDSPFIAGAEGVAAALNRLNATHAAHPAYLRADGRPVIFFWRPSLYSVDAWRAIRSQTDPNRQHLWISEGDDTSYLPVFDGHFLYSNTWNPPANLLAINQKFADRVASATQTLGAPKLWVATVMPGYDDTRIRPAGFARDRAGGDYYADSWQAAIASRPAWIVINSFNEWPEGTYIEPSVAFGDQYIGLTAAWSSTFKGKAAPVVQAASQSAAPPEQPTPLPPVDEPTAFVAVTLLNLRAGPGTEYDILDQAAYGVPLPITGYSPERPGWWQIRHDGAMAWVYGPLVTTTGPMDKVAIIEYSSTSPQGAEKSIIDEGSSVSLLLNRSRRPLTPHPLP